jgi:serine/threonine-protein kinase HipA
MYDVNPVIYGNALSLNVSENDSALSFDLARETSSYYEIDFDDAKGIISDVKKIVSENWQIVAIDYGLTRNAISRMEQAFAMELK